MIRSDRDKLDDAVSDLLGYAAVLDIVQGYMVQNAVASIPLNGVASMPDCRVHFLTPNEARAFDFVLTMMVSSAEDLRVAYTRARS